MKTMLLSIALLLSLSAVAQEQRDATLLEDQWIKLQALTMGDEQEIRDHLASHGIGVTHLKELRDLVAKTEKEIHEGAVKRITDLCANRAKYENNRELMAQADESNVAWETAQMQEAIDSLPQVIGQADYLSFLQFVGHEGPAKAYTNDFATAVRAGTANPKDYLDRVCKE